MAEVRGVIFLAPLLTSIFLLVVRFLDFQELFDNRLFHVSPQVCVCTIESLYNYVGSNIMPTNRYCSQQIDITLFFAKTVLSDRLKIATLWTFFV